MLRLILFLFIVFGISVVKVPQALALRPFVTTDADVAGPYAIELEWGIFGFTIKRQPGPDDVRIQSPSLRFNLGFPNLGFGDWEIVLETVHEFIDKKDKDLFESDTDQFTLTAGFIKNVWYRGEDWKPNVATETGLLYPTERGADRARGADFEGILIMSWFFPSFTWHLTMGGATHHSTKEEVSKIKAECIYGTIIDVPVPGRERFHLVSEYTGEKIEGEELQHQLLGGIVVHGPWGMDFDAAGFGALNATGFPGATGASVDWGFTSGVTISTKIVRRRDWEIKKGRRFPWLK